MALLLAAGPARADVDTRVLRVAPSADVSLPYWCDWSYDWEARCWRDFSDRFSIGGDEDKVWRAALRFPLTTIPSRSAVVSATLHLSFDVSEQVIEWVEYGAANDGLLLKLADGEEDFGAGGPRLPAAEFADPPQRPLLEVTYMPA